MNDRTAKLEERSRQLQQLALELFDIRVIGFGMHGDIMKREQMLSAGASAYLNQAGSPETLINTIQRLYSHS